MGMKVEHASYAFGDKHGVIQDVTIKDSLLKKKHVAIPYHKTREATATGIMHRVPRLCGALGPCCQVSPGGSNNKHTIVLSETTLSW
jgi:hypothetical protein